MIKDFFNGFKSGLKQFGEIISLVVNTILLFLVYTFAVGITAITARFVGKKFLDTSLNHDATTYWTDLKLKKKSIDHYYKQF